MINKILALIGALLVIAGCFLPIVSVGPDSLNFFDDMPVTIPDIPQNALLYEAITLILLAVASVILTFTGKAKFTWLSGFLIGTLIAVTYIQMDAKTSEIKQAAGEQMENLLGGILKEVTDSLLQTVVVGGNGWYVIAGGAVFLITASLVKTK